MKVESKISSVEKLGDVESIKGELSHEDVNKIWDMLQDPYKDPIAAIVREVISNSVDSHIEAKCEDVPVIVSIDYDEDTNIYTWSSEDFGVGMSPERISKVFMQYGKSTKDKSNDAIGGFGIGGKSPLSYQDSCTYLTRYDGIEYLYVLRKGETGPEMDKIYETPTNEPNGTKVSVAINNYSDAIKFKDATVNQMSYFENIYYKFDNTIPLSENESLNNYVILDADNFRICQIKTTDSEGKDRYSPGPMSSVHVCLGRVTYPIVADKLSLENRDLFYSLPPVALKFSVGELSVIPTREDLKYTEKTIKAISDKLAAVEKELIEKFSKVVYHDNILDYYESLKTTSIKIGDVNYISSHPTLKNKVSLKGLEHISVEKLNRIINSRHSVHDLFVDYVITSKYTNKGSSSKFNYNDTKKILSDYFYNSSSYKHIIYLAKEELVPKKTRYIASKLSYSSYRYGAPYLYIVRKSKPSLRKYKEVLNINSTNREYWRDIIKAFQNSVDALIQRIPIYEQVLVPDTFEPKKTANRISLDNDDVYVNVLTPEMVYTYSTDFIIDSKVYKVSDLKNKDLIVYEFKVPKKDSELTTLLHYYGLTKINFNKSKILFLQINQRDIKKYFKDCNNIISMEKFSKCDNDLARKILTRITKSWIVNKLEQSTMFSFSSRTGIAEIDQLITYFNKENSKGLDFRAKSVQMDSLVDQCIANGYIEDLFVDNLNRYLYICNLFNEINIDSNIDTSSYLCLVQANKVLKGKNKIKLGEIPYLKVSNIQKNQSKLSNFNSDKLIDKLAYKMNLIKKSKNEGNYVSPVISCGNKGDSEKNERRDSKKVSGFI